MLPESESIEKEISAIDDVLFYVFGVTMLDSERRPDPTTERGASVYSANIQKILMKNGVSDETITGVVSDFFTDISIGCFVSLNGREPTDEEVSKSNISLSELSNIDHSNAENAAKDILAQMVLKAISLAS